MKCINCISYATRSPARRPAYLLDHAAGDALAPAAQRHRLVGVVVAAGVDHEGLALDLGQALEARRRQRQDRTAVAAHHQRWQVAHVAAAGGPEVLLGAARVVVPAGGAGRHLLAVLFVGGAAARLVYM